MLPSLGESLSVFIALAPAVYSGPLTHGFPFTAIKHMDWKRWKRIFGVLDFIPIMTISYNWTPSLPFALLGYQVSRFALVYNESFKIRSTMLIITFCFHFRCSLFSSAGQMQIGFIGENQRCFASHLLLSQVQVSSGGLV